MTDHDQVRLDNGKLRPCPNSPNCVCSEFPGSQHSIEPLAITGSPDAAWARLVDIVKSHPRTTIVSQNESYLHARVRTLLFRFEDVLEFRLERSTGKIQVRSASKVGHSDLGVNRRRVESIRKRFVSES
ncbi:MAG: DUF1499 domain-containing protein [Rhodopirellula sp.]|nr:DUF1499 domain-containing protein [Rhodopirellula sp.]